jgi:hypothetical protein
MTTGAERTNFADKRNLPQQRIKDTFFDYLANRLADITYRAWGSQTGVFGTATLTGGTDEVDVGTLPVSLLEGNGNVLSVVGTDGTDLKFENALGITYYVGARHTLIPDGVKRNPRNDVINYDVWVDGIGESSVPNSVVESAGQLNMIVDSIFEAGVSHAGRLVTVYLNQPATDIESVAIERNVVATWDGSNNRILTSALLGQAGGSASTIPGDYTVVAQGVTIRRNTDLQVTPPYAFLGTATGAGAGGTPTTSVVGQVDITSGILNNLDESYDASASGAKIIQVDDGAVTLEGAAPGDGQNAVLRLSRLGSTDWMQFGLTLQIGTDASIPLAILQSVDRGGGSVLQAQESVDQTAPDILTFTRGGSLDLQDSGLRLDPALHVVLLETGPEANTLYVIKSIPSSSTIQVMGLQSSGVPSPWTTGSGRTARVLVPKVVFANDAVHQYVAGTTLDLWKGELHVLRDGEGNDAPLRVYPDGATAAAVLEFYSDRLSPSYPAVEYAPDGVMKLGDPEKPAGFVFVANPQGDADRGAHLIIPAPVVPANGDLPSHRASALFNEEQKEVQRWTMWGNRLDGARWIQKFLTVTQPSDVNHTFNGAGTITYNDATSNATHGGVANFATGAVAGNNNQLEGPQAWVLDNTQVPTIQRIVYVRARVRLTELTNIVVKVGFKATGVAYYRFESTVNSGKWEFRNDDGGGGAETTTDTGVTATSGTANDDFEVVDLWIKLDLPGNLITFWMTGMTLALTQAFENAPTGWSNVRGFPFVFIETKDATARGMQAMELECWDENIQGGPEE